MRSGNHGRARLIVALLFLGGMVVVLGGCSNFKSSKRVDMGPFAENTINLLADIRAGMDAQTSVYLRDYAGEGPIVEYRTNWLKFRPMLRGIGAYSIAIVTISKSRLNEKEKCQKLAEVLDEMLRPRIRAIDSHKIVTEEELDTMLAEIREQTQYLNALNAAQPLVDAIENFSNAYLDFMQDKLDNGRAFLDTAVKEDHAVSQKFYKLLVETQNFAFEDLVLLREYRQGFDETAMDRLLERDPQLKLIVPSTAEATPENVLAMQERLLYRLERVRQMTAQVQPDLDLFRQKMLELDTVSKAASNNLMKARITVIIWARSHRGLAQGITDPAKFDVMGIAKQALSTALPLP